MMGASGASTQLIFFVSALIVATAVVAVAANGVYKITNGIDQKSDNVEKDLMTDIAIINDPDEIPNDPVRIYVKNVGRTVLNQNYITVMLDGIAVTNYTLTLSGSTFLLLGPREYADDLNRPESDRGGPFGTGDHRERRL